MRVFLTLGVMLCVVGVRADDLAELCDEFGDAGSLYQWGCRDVDDGQPNSYERLDIGQSREGCLTIVPKACAWYRDGMGPMIYKRITGDFIASAYVVARSRRDPSRPPSQAFNSGGLIARDPASRPGRQNWVVINVGRQQEGLGTEVKTTVNSESQLFCDDGPCYGEVRMARLGSQFHLLRKLVGEADWRLLRVFDRPDLPETLQVGLMCNGWTDQPDALIEVDWVRFARPNGPNDVTRDLPAR